MSVMNGQVTQITFHTVKFLFGVKIVNTHTWKVLFTKGFYVRNMKNLANCQKIGSVLMVGKHKKQFS